MAAPSLDSASIVAFAIPRPCLTHNLFMRGSGTVLEFACMGPERKPSLMPRFHRKFHSVCWGAFRNHLTDLNTVNSTIMRTTSTYPIIENLVRANTSITVRHLLQTGTFLVKLQSSDAASKYLPVAFHIAATRWPIVV